MWKVVSNRIVHRYGLVGGDDVVLDAIMHANLPQRLCTGLEASHATCGLPPWAGIGLVVIHWNAAIIVQSYVDHGYEARLYILNLGE
jgi:hypothetical protein